MFSRLRYLVLPACFLILLIGCATNKNRSASLAGKVMYKGAPVTGGQMTIYVGEGNYPTGINKDGTFSVGQLPEGEATVTVNTDALNPNKPTYGAGGGGKGPMSSPIPDAGKGKEGVYVKIPDKYKDKAKTDLKVTLKGGRNSKDFELTD